MKAARHAVLFCSTVAIGSGCGAGGERAPDTQGRAPATTGDSVAEPSPRVDEACPLTVAGTTATVENTVDGIVLAFATTPAGVVEVRQRVARLAELHNRAPSDRTTAPVTSAGKPVDTAATAPAADAARVAARASTEISAGGARLVLRPVDAAHIDSFRDRLRRQADAMLKGTCDRETRHHDGDGQVP